jgi:putative ABC transport system permease protein
MNQLAFILAYRQLIKNKWYAAVKIGSLAFGFLFFIFIVLYYQYEHSYEKWNPNYERVARLEFEIRDSAITQYPVMSYPNNSYLQEFCKEELEATTVIDAIPALSDQTIAKDKTSDPFYLKGVLYSDSMYFDVFKYPFIYGSSETALKESKSIVLIKEISERLFGKTNPVGKTIVFNASTQLKVGGVIDISNCPSHQKFEGVVNTLKKDERWTWRHFYVYYLLSKNVKMERVSKKMDLLMRNNYFSKVELREEQNRNTEFTAFLRPVKDIHLNSDSIYELNENANKLILNILLGIGIGLMIITAINFFNLTVIQLSTRSKEIITSILFSASKTKVYYRFIIETLVYVLAALFLTFVLVELGLDGFEEVFSIRLSLFAAHSPTRIIFVVLFVIIVLGIVGGIVPIYHLSKQPPSVILKGNYTKNQLGKRFLNILLTIQFSIAFIAIVGFTVVIQQVTFIFMKPLGFNKYNVICVKTHNTTDKATYRRVKNRLLEHKSIEAVSFNFSTPGDVRLSSPTIKHNKKALNTNVNFITSDYDKVLQLKIKEGRFFRDSISPDSVTEILLTETAVKMNQLKNPSIPFANKENQVVGVINDYFHQKVGDAQMPIALINRGCIIKGGKLMIRVTTLSDKSTLEHIKLVMKELEPDYPFAYTYLDNDYTYMYKDLGQLSVIFFYVLFVSSILIIIGLFSVSAFIARQRIKEIAIRLVLGATSFQIIAELNKRFMKIIFISVAISAPISYILCRYWLNGFVDHYNLNAWPFIIASFILISTAIVINAIVGNKTISVKPVKSLKYE